MNTTGLVYRGQLKLQVRRAVREEVRQVKIVLERNVLAEAVAWTARALPARPTVPVLAGIRLQAGEELVLSSFDYDQSAQATVPVTTEQAGSALVSGRLLAEISRSLPARPVHIETDDGRVVLACGSTTFTLLTMPEDEYPALPEMPPAAGTIGSDVFATAVSQAISAACRDDALPTLTGVRIEIEGETLTLVSTDRYRLAISEVRWTPTRPDISAALLVPARSLAETARSLTNGVQVSIALGLPGAQGNADDGMVGFESSGRRTTSRLLGGEYPRYRSLLPKTENAAAELSTGLLTEAIKRVALVAERNTSVRLSFSVGELMLEAGTGDEAQAEETIEAEFSGDDLSVAFDPQYLLDGLAATDSDTVRIAFTAPGKPALLTGKPGTDGNPEFRYLMMPRQ
jgi:DNA polymerase III subunit beta